MLRKLCNGKWKRLESSTWNEATLGPGLIAAKAVCIVWAHFSGNLHEVNIICFYCLLYHLLHACTLLRFTLERTITIIPFIWLSLWSGRAGPCRGTLTIFFILKRVLVWHSIPCLRFWLLSCSCDMCSDNPVDIFKLGIFYFCNSRYCMPVTKQ